MASPVLSSWHHQILAYRSEKSPKKAAILLKPILAHYRLLVEGMVRVVPKTRQSAKKGDVEDLRQTAYLGLVIAFRGWDPARGPFEGYAKIRIADELREVLGRTRFKDGKDTCYVYATDRRALASWRAKNGTEPTATELGMSEKRFQALREEEWCKEYHLADLYAVQRGDGETSSSGGWEDAVASPSPSPEDVAQVTERMKLFPRAIRERVVAVLEDRATPRERDKALEEALTWME